MSDVDDGTRIGSIHLLTGAVLMALTSARYYSLDPDVYFQREVYEERCFGFHRGSS